MSHPKKAVFVIAVIAAIAGAGSMLAGAGAPATSGAVPVFATARSDDTSQPTTSTIGGDPAPSTVPAESGDLVLVGEEPRTQQEHPENRPSDPVRDAVPGAGTPPPAGPADPIGELDDERPVPAGFDFTAPPKRERAPNPYGGPTGLAVAPSCSHQCITRGVAYPRGFGALLVVETEVPAKLFMTVIADLDEDGDYEDVHVESTPHRVTQHAWPLDHLAPGETYHVMAAATDEHGHTAYVWGDFTTLSQRDVFVELGTGQIVGGPGNISSTQWLLGLDGPLADVTPGQAGILLYRDLPRQLDLEFWVLRGWDDEECEVWTAEGAPAHGHDGASCLAWNSTEVDDVDLDKVPAGSSHWTQTSVALSLHPPTGAGNALPPGYGDPYYFSFEVPVILHVTYS